MCTHNVESFASAMTCNVCKSQGLHAIHHSRCIQDHTGLQGTFNDLLLNALGLSNDSSSGSSRRLHASPKRSLLGAACGIGLIEIAETTNGFIDIYDSSRQIHDSGCFPANAKVGPQFLHYMTWLRMKELQMEMSKFGIHACRDCNMDGSLLYGS